ncbi:MAG: hypothetical protein EBT86_06335 [Actinobacteria bacterium]|nr:hypothetical protein [Actinomycetota bacterium]
MIETSVCHCGYFSWIGFIFYQNPAKQPPQPQPQPQPQPPPLPLPPSQPINNTQEILESIPSNTQPQLIQSPMKPVLNSARSLSQTHLQTYETYFSKKQMNTKKSTRQVERSIILEDHSLQREQEAQKEMP